MASVYTNDLRLEEIGSGEQSGTWGDTTNTNLELIAEAFSFGTEAITTNADTHTTTIADGATDPGRSIFLKYTGALDSACTVTLAPNSVSKLWFIENATTDSGSSGPYNLIISQGSGASVTIPAGQTKAVYSNGAGSTAAIVDAFATLDVVDLRVDDDLTVVDDATIGGTLGVTGVVTANAGVVVDNITIDGTEIDLSSGDLTLDVAGDIILDADGGEVLLKDGGTTYGQLKGATFDFIIQSLVDDKDIIFKGSDAGGVITSLTLDMSNAGAATFNSSVTASGPIQALGGQDLRAFSSDDSVFLSIKHNEIDLSSGDLTLDVAGDIILDADGADILLKHDGTHWGSIYTNATPNNLFIQSMISDGDIYLSGIDGGSSINALILDMSEAGAATFNAGANFGGVTDINGTLTVSPNTSGKDTFSLSTNAADDARLQMKSDTTTKVDIQANGVSYLNGGNVGIGTSLPDTKLVVANGSDTLKSNLDSDSIDIFASGKTFNFGTTSDNVVRFFQNNAERMRIDSSGNVLVGNGVSHVDVNTGPDITIGSSGNADTDGSAIGFVHNGSDLNAYIGGQKQFLTIGTYTATPFRFITSNAERMRIDGTGFVAISGANGLSEVLNSGTASVNSVSDNAALEINTRSATNGHSGILNFIKAPNTSGTPTATADGEFLGRASFIGFDTGNTLRVGAQILAVQSGTDSDSVPTRLILNTSSGTSDPVNRFEISTAETIVNEDSNDTDFRVESDGNANMFVVDAGNNRVNIGEVNTLFNATATVTRNDTASLSDFEGNLMLFDNAGSSTSTNGGHLLFSGHDGTSVRGFAKIIGGKGNSTSGEYDGSLLFKVRDHGDSSILEKLRIKSGETTFNELGGNQDFRVESDSNANMIFVDGGNNAVGINDSTPNSYPANNQTTTATDGGIFRIGGSVGAICASATGNELAYTRSGFNYISSPNGGFSIRSGSSGGVSLSSGATSWTSISDERLKTLTGDIENAIDKVKTLRTKMGHYNDDSQKVSHPFLIAQDVKAVLPEAVSVIENDPNVEDKTGVTDKLYLSYTDVIPLLTAALKESIAKNEKLEARITALENA